MHLIAQADIIVKKTDSIKHGIAPKNAVEIDSQQTDF